MQIRPPNRVTRSYVQRLNAPPARVFPLPCPLREAVWIEGRDPQFVITESGVAGPGCVFVTAAEPPDPIWVVTRHQPHRLVETLKICPGVTVGRRTIALHAADSGCEAQVTDRHTSLGPAGDAFVAGFTEMRYSEFMRARERRLKHYLDCGRLLRAGAS
jgi:hypothetical protein